jgi:hypothetical protein
MNMMSKNFKSSLLKTMGDGVNCITSVCPNGSRITTYSKITEIPQEGLESEKEVLTA